MVPLTLEKLPDGAVDLGSRTGALLSEEEEEEAHPHPAKINAQHLCRPPIQPSIVPPSIPPLSLQRPSISIHLSSLHPAFHHLSIRPSIHTVPVFNPHLQDQVLQAAGR